MGAVSPVVLGFVVFQQEAVHLLKILVMSSLYRDAFELSGQNADGCLDAIDVVIENDLLFLRIDVDNKIREIVDPSEVILLESATCLDTRCGWV